METVIRKGKVEVKAGYEDEKVVLVIREGKKECKIVLETTEAEILSDKLELLAFKKSHDAWEKTKKVISDLEEMEFEHLTDRQRKHLLDPEVWYDFNMSH